MEACYTKSDHSVVIRSTHKKVCNKLRGCKAKLKSEKTATLPKRNAKVLIVDSSGKKHTTLVDQNEVENIDILKVMKMEKNSHEEKLSSKGNETKKKGSENTKKETKDHALPEKSLNSDIFQSKSTQTEDLDITNGCGPFKTMPESLSQICYQDNDKIHQNPNVPSFPAKQTGDSATGDGNKLNTTALNLSTGNQKEIGPELQVQESPVGDLSNQNTTKHFVKNRTAQALVTVKSDLAKRIDRPPTVHRKVKKIHVNWNTKSVVLVILSTVMFFCFFVVFGTNLFTDIFYAISLPFFGNIRRRELTKTEIIIRYIRCFFGFLYNIFDI